MMSHGQPWQGVVASMFTSHLIVASGLLISLVSGYFNWSIFITCVSLVVALICVVRLIPTMLNLSRSFFSMDYV